MNINDFIITVLISVTIGIVIGMLLLWLIKRTIRLYRHLIRRPRYLKPFKAPRI